MARVTDADLQLALTAFREHGHSGILPGTRYRMNYLVLGSGPPLVMIHGMADRAPAFLMVMHRLMRDFTCIAYDLPDGKTDHARLANYTHGDYVSDLIELLDFLGLPEASILGSSFGSTIAIAAAASHPVRFSTAILQGGFAHRPLNRWQRYLCLLARYWPGWFGDWPRFHMMAMRMFAGPTVSMLPAKVRDFLFRNGGQTPIRASALRTLAIDRTDLRSRLPEIHTPLLLIGGDRDTLVPRECEKLIEQAVPGASRVEIPGCGHYPQYTHPSEMAEAILQFAVIS